MAYLTRDDGEHFVIPSYRDVLSAKQKSVLKRDIHLLSESYGGYITMQKKGTLQYEVAFSPDTGYLLGESIWHYFKKPQDMIYCEAIPNTTEAILVIVKNESVYLDGSFPFENISEELVIFLTQQNNFEIYIYGNVPISETPEEDKFSFEPGSIKSFTILDEPVFQKLPLLKPYQLQLVDVALKQQGIGVFPTRQLLMVVIALGLVWMLWSYFTRKPTVIVLPAPVVEANPYQQYIDTLKTPDPNTEIQQVLNSSIILFSMPGWIPASINYAKGKMTVTVNSRGGKIESLFNWAQANQATVNLTAQGIYLSITIPTENRPVPKTIYPVKDVLARISDNLNVIYPGNNLTLGKFNSKGVFTIVPITFTFTNISPAFLSLIAKQFKDLPLSLQSIIITVANGSLSGSITLDALGS